ncbi:MAG: MFS transporter [Goleter apudmare HA4340-LM2]|jgi:MFS family permease|nr:MFS transporter [Goleter apudmare HA4340-LM2]
MTTSPSQLKILWLQVCSLAGVQGAITLSWLIYGIYLPQLLAQFGFPPSWVVGILVVENALAVVMEPLIGGLSDRSLYRLGTSFPYISVGVILSSGLFISIPCVVTFTPPLEVFRLVLPVVLVAWALAMTVFRTPVMVLLGIYATPAQIPLAASVVTFTGAALGALRPIFTKWVLNFPPILAFAIASFVLLGAAAVLRHVHPPNLLSDRTRAEKIPVIPLQKLALILGTGVGVAWGSRLLMDAVGKLLKVQINADNVDLQMVGIGILIAVATFPTSLLAVRITIKPAMLLGISATILSMLMMLYLGTPILVILLMATGFSLIINAAIPFPLSLMPPHWAGLGIGTYFGGIGLAMSVFGVVFPQQQVITPTTGLIGGALAFLFAGVCIAASGNLIMPRDAEV